jgi:Spy/CpxP family protein refolding chaperone
MDDRKKTIGMIVLCCLLFLFVGVRFWSMATASRQQEELNSRSSPIQQRIVSRVGPPRMALKDPFGELGLTAEQRRKIDDIMNASMTELPPSGAGGGARRNVLFTMGAGPVPPGPGEALTAAPGPNGPHVVRITLPMDKIRAILSPEQQRKFDQMHQMRIGSGGGPAAP